MAHYSSDCWDAEILTSYGWVETVGIADRSAYDLTRHAQFSKKDLVAARKYTQPKLLKVIEVKLNKPLIGKTFKQDNKPITDYLECLNENTKAQMKEAFDKKESFKITIKDKEFTITPEMATLELIEKIVMEEKYVPNVIEPAFGIGRIIYASWEHNFKKRTEERTYIALPPKIAPYKCSILTVVCNDDFEKYVNNISEQFKKAGISHKADTTGQSIGKRYARTDEVGIPFGITIDHKTLEENTVTLREIVTTQQVRIPVAEVIEVINSLSEDAIIWEDVVKKYPLFTTKEDE
jgi:glycyl-tRNA synthetase